MISIGKVETIGDAYMVVGGVPVTTETHAHRVANFALGMRIAAKEVANPITGEPIQVRLLCLPALIDILCIYFIKCHHPLCQ